MFQTKRNAFTMIELVFVIVVIGILAAIAVPKLAATRDDATIARARTTVAAVRSAISAERQKRILKGDFANPITALSNNAANVFDTFNADRDGDTNRVLEYPVVACMSATARNCWKTSGPSSYQYVMYDGTPVNFSLTTNGRLDCIGPVNGCNALTR